MDETIFFSHLETYLDKKNISELKKALSEEQIFSSLIIDEEKISREEILHLYPSIKPHPLVKNVFLFNKKELDLGKSLLFEIGAFYIFEPCSSLVGHFLSPQEDDIILDLAASPGGKCIHTSFLMHNKGQIIANEISSSRAKILSSNVEKYGRKNITVTSANSKQLLVLFKEYFSKIILDAPCSGSGMFRKENKMKDDWTIEKVISLAKLQKELILDAYDMLQKGGEMIYSTCSFSFEEDEEVINYLLANRDAELIPLPHFEGEYRSSLKESVHLLPHLFNGEGHFICKIKKPGMLEKKYHFEKSSPKINLPLSGQFYISGKQDVYLTNYLLPLKNIRILRNGLKIGHYDKKIGWVYDHALSRLNNNFLIKIALSKEEAIQYIYGLSITKNIDNGYVVLTYLGIPFALGKVTNHQIKNHYPKGLRKKL